MERLIGTLPPLICSRRRPYAVLVNSVSRRVQAQWIRNNANACAPGYWAGASGQPSGAVTGRVRQAHVVPTSGPEKAALSPPSYDASALTVLELHAIKDVLVLEGVDEVPERF